MSPSAPAFRDPGARRALSLRDALRNTPVYAATRGFYFHELLRVARAVAPEREAQLFEGVTLKSFVPIFNYSLREYMTLLTNVARIAYPYAPLHDGVRMLGQRMYAAFQESAVGPSTTRAADASLDAVLRVSPTIIALSVQPGSVRATRIGERHWQAHYSEIYCFLDTFHVGVVEGVIKRFGATPDVRVALTGHASGIFDVRWR